MQKPDSEYLDLFPKKLCSSEINDGLVTVIYFRKKTKFDKLLEKIITPKPSKIDLDNVGSFIWEHIDGKDNIKTIMLKTIEKFGEEIDPAEERVILFFKQMFKTNLIGLYKKTTD